ncbi:threonine/serine exporter ThrE family protein [Streptomyces sp. NPDC087300]|uniref:threonine/serine ThrE exporter family protein n=1 Tax=Streptomyces sp. NPDC087300 TaxID=3365780 RepID=UPI0037F507E5
MAPSDPADGRRRHRRPVRLRTRQLPRAAPDAAVPDAPAEREPAVPLRRMARRAGRGAVSVTRLWRRRLPPPDTSEPPPPPKELVRFLRDCGVALCRAGEISERVQRVVTTLGTRYGLHPVHAFVLPTGVFVRVGDGPDSVVDFAPVRGDTLRLDQIGTLYAFVRDLYEHPVDPAEGTERLRQVYALPARFSAPLRVLGYTVMTLGLGFLTVPSPMALIGYAALGAAVGTLRETVAARLPSLMLALPVLAAVLVTVLAYRYSGPLLGENPAKLLIPPLITFLPGAALTMGTMELAAGSIVSGSSRLIYGMSVLVLLTFGITVGSQLMTAHPIPHGTAASSFGAWAPWAGALLLAVGYLFNSSAAARSLPWLMLALVLVEGTQQLGNALFGSLFGAFLGGMSLPVFSQIMQRWRSAPPSQVTFLPAFWLLVPGALSLTGVGELLVGQSDRGLPTIVSALMTVVAVALGVLVGAGATQPREAGAADDPSRAEEPDAPEGREPGPGEPGEAVTPSAPG